MLKSFANYLTRKLVEKQNATRKKQFLNWEKIEKIALILDSASAMNKSELDKFTGKTQKYIDVYYIELNTKNPSFADWICFTKKDKTILGLPKSHTDSSFKNRNYQMVINASQKYSLFAASIVSKINSPYNCGCSDLFGETDLVIERLSSKNITAYLDDVAKYLQMIKTG